METIVTLDGVRDGLRRCGEVIAGCEGRLGAIAQQESSLAAERSQLTNKRERLRKAWAALEALRLVLEAESG